MIKIKQKLTALSVWWLNRQLMRDAGLYQSYKANIAMAFYDEFKRQHPQIHQILPDIHMECNRGADRFLAMWRRQP